MAFCILPAHRTASVAVLKQVRIPSQAESGKIYISEVVHNNISNKKGISSLFIKEVLLKNVKDPVKIYAVLVDHTLLTNKNIFN